MLGSINLSEFIKDPFTKYAEFDAGNFRQAVRDGVVALNEVLHEGLPLHPLEEQRKSVNDWRQIGLGIFGWHDALIKLGIRYGSKESLELAHKIGFDMINNAVIESANLTRVYGQYPKYNAEAVLNSEFFLENTDNFTKNTVKSLGLANSQLLTIPPTGSIGTMLGVSTGIEPIYNVSYTRKTESLHGEDKYYKVYTPIIKKYMELNSIEDERNLPEFINCAIDLNYKERIKMQSAWQKHIDASISSTVNLPKDTTIEDVENLYMMAWEKGLKGVTIYRDGCNRAGILSNEIKEENNSSIIEWGTTIKCTDDLIGKKRKIISGCGNVHVLAYFDPVDGKLMELYLSKGSSGGCNSWMTSNSRIISAAMRTGMGFDYLIDQLKSAPTCPSYSVRKATKGDTSKGNCCPTAVANALIDMQDEVFDDLGIYDEEEKTNIKSGNLTDKRIVAETKRLCPECGTELAFQGGCSSCNSCGWTLCE